MLWSEVSRGGASALAEEARRPTGVGAVTLVFGTDGDDVLTVRTGRGRPSGGPTKGDDEIHGRGGNDRIDGSGGNDLIFGDYADFDARTMEPEFARDDTLRGGRGADSLYGDGRYGFDELAGSDRLTGDSGNDLLVGDCEYLTECIAGRDELYGGRGKDRLFGDAIFQGGPQFFADDRLFGGAGDDELYGDSFSGVELYEIGGMWASGGDDVLDGGAGGDLLVGGTGDDNLTGGSGRDTFRFGAKFFDGPSAGPEGTWIGSGEDVITDFRSGQDRLDLTGWGLDGRILDNDGDGRITAADIAVTRDGRDLILELQVASGIIAEGGGTIRLLGVGALSIEDLVPLPPG